MAKVTLNGSQILDWEGFHNVCAAEFGFPDFYGRNLDAWIDCVSHVDSGDGMTRFAIGRNELLEIEVINSAVFRERCPEILSELSQLIEFVNQRFVESGDRPPLRLILQ